MANEATMTMAILAGKCKGGPWDGQQFAHDAKSKEFFEPVIKGIPMNIENAEIIPHKIGEYYWGSNGLWIWLPEGTRSRHRA